MAKAIFTTRVSPSYDDRPEDYYHFPRMYLNQVRAAVGDQIIYYEPRRVDSSISSRGGRQAYFASARVDGIREDANTPDHFYADISNFLPFSRAVPFREGDHYYESRLRAEGGKTNVGWAQRAVRNIPEAEFDLIFKAGFAAVLLEERTQSVATPANGLEDPAADFDRPIVEVTYSRPFRDRAFMHAVRAAYDNRCAFTGLRLINGGGRPEVQAAHIKPVAEKGPGFNSQRVSAFRNGPLDV
jgi:putative restriction endonuclease